MALLEQRNDWPDKADWNALDTEISELWESKEYRPVALGVIRDSKGRLLMVRSAKNPEKPNLPQGGIDPRESLLPGLFRELYEELGITSNQLSITGFLGTHREEHPDATDKRGFTKGKAYFAFELEYHGPERLKIRAPEEIESYEWIGEPSMFNSMRNAFKRKIANQVLQR